MNVCSTFLPFSESQKHTFTYSLCTLCHVNVTLKVYSMNSYSGIWQVQHTLISSTNASLSLYFLSYIYYFRVEEQPCTAAQFMPCYFSYQVNCRGIPRASSLCSLQTSLPCRRSFGQSCNPPQCSWGRQEHVMKPQECLHGRLSSNLICSVFCLQVAPSEENRTEFLIKNVVSIKETII